MKVSPTVQEVGWFEKIKNYVKFDELLKKLNDSKYKLLDMALFAGIGFLIGFLETICQLFYCFFCFSGWSYCVTADAHIGYTY